MRPLTRPPRTQVFSILITAILVMGCLYWGLPRYLRHEAKNQVTQARAAILVPQGQGACEETVAAARPQWAPEGWIIQCVDTFQAPPAMGAQGLRISALTNSSLRLIEVARSTPKYSLRYTVIHEWAHALNAERTGTAGLLWWSPPWDAPPELKAQEGERTKLWQTLARKASLTHRPRAPQAYFKLPEEILAHSVAICLRETQGANAFLPAVPCGEVKALFPEFFSPPLAA